MTAASTVPAYPTRPPYFAHKFCRLLTKAAVAQRIGPEACWLLAVIVHQEDAVHYSHAVDFYNDQLMSVCGFGGRSRLVTARRKAIEAGWLNYVEGGKSRPGTYWVRVPEKYSTLPDGACDESESGPESGQEELFPVPNQDGKQEMPSQNRTATGRQPDGKSSPSYPVPNPVPKKEPAGAGVPADLLALIDGWNSLPAGIVKAGNGANRDPVAKATLKGWTRAQRDQEQREALSDPPRLLDAIRRASFCHAQGWFSLPWLFATNKAGEFNVVKLLNGGYEGNGNGKPKPTLTPGPGQRHPDDANRRGF